MAYETIIYEKETGIATLTFNRPHVMNATNYLMNTEMRAAVAEARDDDEVRVLIITGAGRGFCSGADVTGLVDTFADSPWRLTAKSPAAGGIRSNTFQLRVFEKPIIAAVNGPAAGAGFSIALACDIRIASDRASFSQAFIRRGLVPDTGSTYFLSRTVGMAKACEMVFTGEAMNAEQAKEYGLVSRVVPHDELMPVVREMAAKIAAGPPIAMKLAKRAMYRGATTDLASALEFEGYMQGICFGTEDFKEGASAFLEKREPRFKGK